MAIVEEFLEIKENTDADILAMQVGDFYEFFAEDARTVSNKLGLKVSEKSSHGSSYPMAGVPRTELPQYTKQLAETHGLAVAVAEQYEQSGQHHRRIVRTVTPSTLLESQDGHSEYLCSVFVDEGDVGLAFSNIESGQVLMTDSTEDELLADILVYEPVEILLSTTDVNPETLSHIESTLASHLDARVHRWAHNTERRANRGILCEEFGLDILTSLDIDTDSLALASAGVIVSYLSEVLPKETETLSRLTQIQDDAYVRLDARTRRSLELTETRSTETGTSLFDTLDNTVSPTGANKLRKYVQRPLTSQEKITERQKSVSAFARAAVERTQMRETLEQLPNFARIASQSSYGNADPHEIARLPEGLASLQQLQTRLNNSQLVSTTPLADRVNELDFEQIQSVAKTVDSALVTNPPNTVTHGVIATGYDDELDSIVTQYRETKQWLDNLESDIKSQYGLTHVTVDRNQTDGFYIQVGNSEADQVPTDQFEQIKQLKDSRRFKHEPLRQHERTFLRLEEQRQNREKILYDNLLEQVADSAELLQSVGSTVSHIDAILSLAVHSVSNDWTQPTIEQTRGIEIVDGRHPVVEQDVEFVPNGTTLQDGCDFTIVTGPNMAGKSTYLRQTALIVLLAQIGSHVPADSAEIGIVDGIYTRVGAMDEISKGRSTFMVEMSELANILHSSTGNSLVILDEVGRGTANSDGVSIAQSTIEYLADTTNSAQTPLTLFATHYHELTELVDEFPNMRNLHVAVEPGDDKTEYTFLREIRDGPADSSYGIQVAELAGVPQPVINRSETLLNQIKDNTADETE